MIIEIRIVRISLNDVRLKSFDWIIVVGFLGEEDFSVYNCYLRNFIKGALFGCRCYPVNDFYVKICMV